MDNFSEPKKIPEIRASCVTSVQVHLFICSYIVLWGGKILGNILKTRNCKVLGNWVKIFLNIYRCCYDTKRIIVESLSASHSLQICVMTSPRKGCILPSVRRIVVSNSSVLIKRVQMYTLTQQCEVSSFTFGLGGMGYGSSTPFASRTRSRSGYYVDTFFRPLKRHHFGEPKPPFPPQLPVTDFLAAIISR